MMTNQCVRVAALMPLNADQVALLKELEPRIELLYEPDLIAPRRFDADHDGDPDFHRSEAGEKRYWDMVLRAHVLFGIPDGRPRHLARAVRESRNLQWVHTVYAGGGAQVRAARLDDEELRRIHWTQSAGPHARPLAEWALLGVLAGIKNLPKQQRDQRNHHWPYRWPMGMLASQKAVIIGLGKVGRACAELFAANGIKVIGVNRTVKEVPHVHHVYPLDQLTKAVSEASIVVSAVPGTPQTTGMLSAAVLSATQPGSIFVSLGRGKAVDEKALARLLKEGHFSFAALDVFEKEPLPQDSELWDMDNVLIAPHTAGLADNETEELVKLFAANLTRYIDGQDLFNVINTTEFY